MSYKAKLTIPDIPLTVVIIFLVIFSVLMLYSIAPSVFPNYFFYIILGFLAFYLFSRIEFEVVILFSKILYIFSLIFLMLPLFIGEVTRGSVRWIQVGELTVQPAEIVKPFLLVFFAYYIFADKLTIKRFIKVVILAIIPIILILIQPSLGGSVLLTVGYFGVILASSIDKKQIVIFLIMIGLCLPFLYFLLAPYQRQRISSFLDYSKDPYGSGYNAIQSIISVGSGRLIGKGLGKGVQTQLAFLPEKHTDFIFAAISEELGFLGAGLIITMLFILLMRITFFIENSSSPQARAYLMGLFLLLFFQSVVNIGMNLGILPITGLPLPLVSAGGSSFLGTMTALGIAQSSKKKVYS